MKDLLISLIHLYRRILSPVKGMKCPYIPSCSSYAEEAIRVHGAWKGTALALWRILRCNPFSAGGFDPVPQKHVRIVYLNKKGNGPYGS